MKTISYAQIMSLHLCYDTLEIGLTENYEDTIVNFIKEYRHKVKRLENIRWVLVRYEFLSDKQLRLYGVWCARQVQHLMKDKRSFNALDVAEAYANGNATIQELKAAMFDAYAVYDPDTCAVYAAHAAYAPHYAAADAAHYAAHATDNYNLALNRQIDKLLEIFEGEAA